MQSSGVFPKLGELSAVFPEVVAECQREGGGMDQRQPRQDSVTERHCFLVQAKKSVKVWNQKKRSNQSVDPISVPLRGFGIQF